MRRYLRSRRNAPVARHEITAVRCDGAFEDAVIGLVGERVQARATGINHMRHRAEREPGQANPLIVPAELAAENPGDLIENERGEIELDLAGASQVEDGLRLTAAMQRRDKDVRVSDETPGHTGSARRGGTRQRRAGYRPRS